MGKILISNNCIWIKKLKSEIDKYFTESYFWENKKVTTIVYKKLNIESVNYYEKGSNYVLVTGTLIYKGLFGIDALKAVLDDADTQSIKDLRANAIGSYSLTLKIGTRIYIFVDETHTYSLYYSIIGNDFIVTNTYWHIADVTKSKIEATSLLEMGVRRCIMSNHTPFYNIFKLCAAECLVYDVTLDKAEVIKIPLNDYHSNYNKKEEAVSFLLQYIKELSRKRSKYWKSGIHFLTGGIDSRLELAINLYNKDNVAIKYWIGQDLLTNGTENDAQIVTSIANQYNLKMDILNVSEEYINSINSITREKCYKYGEYASVYAGNVKLFNSFENLRDVDFLGFGYLGEIMRPLAELDQSYKEPYSKKDFILDVLCRTGLEKKMFKIEGFYDYIEKEMSPLVSIVGNSGGSIITKEEAFKLFSFSRFEADCVMNNFANMFVYSFPIFGQKKIADVIFSMRYEWLRDEWIPITLINSLEKDLMKFPIYSHHRYFTYSSINNTIKKTLKYQLFDWAKNKFKNSFIYTVLYLKYAHKYIRPESASNDIIVQNCSQVLSDITVLNDTEIEVCLDDKWNGVDIGTVGTFIGDLKVLNCLNTEK